LGQVVIVHGGLYGRQTIPYDRRKRSSKDVSFRPASGAHVVVSVLTVGGRHVELRSIRTALWRTLGTAVDVTLRSVSTSRFEIQGSKHVMVLGGSAGPASDYLNVIAPASPGARQGPSAITLDGVRIEGYARSGPAGTIGCLDVRAASGLTIRNSRLFDCQDFGLRLSASPNAGTPTDVLVENNLFSCCRSGSRALLLDDATTPAWEKVTVRNNSLSGSIVIGPAGSAAHVGVYSNVALSLSGCGLSGVAVDYNVWAAGYPCGPSDMVAPSGFANPAAYDFDLLPDAAAIDHGSPDASALRDIDGQPRPLGAAADAGAKESRSSGLVAAYPLNENAGPTAFDASPEDNDGALNGASWTSAGRFGGAVTFDGANDWITVFDDPSLDLTNSLTLEAWVKPRELGSVWRTVIMKEQPAGLSYGLYGETSSGRPSGSVNVGTELDTRAPSPLQLNSWTHLAGTYDGATLRLYLNAKQVSTRSISGNLITSGSALRVGGNAVWSEWFDGTIDEVRVYRRVLSSREIAKDMTSPIKVAADAAPPSAPTLFAATGSTPTSVSVAWSPATDDTGVAGYGLYRIGGLVSTTGTASYTFGGLACGTTYTFAVDAFDAVGNRSAQASLFAATSACPLPDTQAPTPPAALLPTSSTQSSVSVSWTPSTDNVGVTGYELFRNGTSVGTTTGTSYTVAGLLCGTSYTLGVEAFDAAGNSSPKSSLTASTNACPDTTPPSTPTGLASTGATQTSISVSWNASTDNVAVTGYGLYRNGTSTGSTAAGTRTYTFGSLSCGTSYTLEADAYDAGGNRSGKASLTASTSACPPPPPPGSANVFVAANGSDAGGNCKRFAVGTSNPDPTGSSLCRTLDEGYHLASPGDVVEVEAGGYPAQTLTTKAGATSPNVLLRPASGASVTIDSLTTQGSYATLRDMTVPTGSNHARGWFNSGSNIILDNVDVTGPWANVKITGGTDVTWKNSGLGTPGNTAKRLCAQGDGEPMELSNVTNLLISNVDFYPFQPELGNPVCGPDSNMHLETIRVWDDVNGWTLERSRFHRGDGSGSARVFFSKIGGGDPANITFVNNWFGSSSGTVSIYLTANSACNNYVFAYNHWEEGFVDECSPKTSLKLIGNTGTQPSYLPCMGTANIRDLWAWNTAGSCGTDQWVLDSANSIAALKYASDGYHLQSSSPAIGAGETSQCMSLTGGVDIDGDPRTGPCDAGPDEYSP
jgi:chitodextrinase